MKFLCCGVVYSTTDPETYWCIEKYSLKEPMQKFINGKKVFKQLVYTLFCKKNGCSKLEIHSYHKEKDVIRFLECEKLKGREARVFLERTKNMRIRMRQSFPLKVVQQSTGIPWVYGKSVSPEAQVARYIDESGNRKVFKNNKWEKDLITSKLHIYRLG